jgi:prepilin-type N-terminal cleavage/methylation domain-containing protein
MHRQKAFTLLELIVVIVIIGILATLGFTQYTKMVNRMRGAEIRVVFGEIRQLAIGYRLQNGSINGMTNADVNIGTGVGNIPSSCVSTHYFYYSLSNDGGGISSVSTDPIFQAAAWRCTSGGKNPQGDPSWPTGCPGCRYLQMDVDLNTGVTTITDPYGSGS